MNLLSRIIHYRRNKAINKRLNEWRAHTLLKAAKRRSDGARKANANRKGYDSANDTLCKAVR